MDSKINKIYDFFEEISQLGKEKIRFDQAVETFVSSYERRHTIVGMNEKSLDEVIKRMLTPYYSCAYFGIKDVQEICLNNYEERIKKRFLRPSQTIYLTDFDNIKKTLTSIAARHIVNKIFDLYRKLNLKELGVSNVVEQYITELIETYDTNNYDAFNKELKNIDDINELNNFVVSKRQQERIDSLQRRVEELEERNDYLESELLSSQFMNDRIEDLERNTRDLQSNIDNLNNKVDEKLY